MGPAETTGIVVIVGLVLQGVFKLAEHIIGKYGEGEVTNKQILDVLTKRPCGLNDRQSEQLTKLHDLHDIVDSDGVPLWYVPRSWATTQKEIVTELRGIAETQHRTLSLMLRLEKKLEK